LAALRATEGPLSRAALRASALDPGAVEGEVDVDRVDRCLDSLVADGLVEAGARGRYRLPG
jgi:hypothetical protein